MGATRYCLDSARTDGWLDRIEATVPDFATLSRVIGRRSFAFTLIAGWRITYLGLGDSPERTEVEYLDGTGASTTLSLPDFWRAIVDVVAAEEARGPAPSSPPPVEDAVLQGHLGQRLVLLAPLFGIRLHELVVEEASSVVSFDREGFHETLPLERLASGIRSLARQELNRTVVARCETRARGLEQIAHDAQAAGRYAKAERPLLEAIELWRDAFGEDHVEVLNDVMNLAVSYRRRGEAERAIPMLEQVADELLFCADDDAGTLRHSAFNNLAAAYLDADRVPEAIFIWERSLGALEGGRPSEHRGRILDNLSAAYCLLHDFPRAETFARRGLHEWQRLPSRERDIAVSMSHLGKALTMQDKLAEARDILEASHRSTEQFFGPDHPEYAASLNLLGVLEIAAKRPAVARPLFARSLEMSQRRLPGGHAIVEEAKMGLEHCGTLEDNAKPKNAKSKNAKPESAKAMNERLDAEPSPMAKPPSKAWWRFW